MSEHAAPGGRRLRTLASKHVCRRTGKERKISSGRVQLLRGSKVPTEGLEDGLLERDASTRVRRRAVLHAVEKPTPQISTRDLVERRTKSRDAPLHVLCIQESDGLGARRVDLVSLRGLRSERRRRASGRTCHFDRILLAAPVVSMPVTRNAVEARAGMVEERQQIGEAADGSGC